MPPAGRTGRACESPSDPGSATPVPHLVQRHGELAPEARAERVVLPELGEERDHEAADLVAALAVRRAHLLEHELERARAVARLERGDDVCLVAPRPQLVEQALALGRAE